MCEEIKKEITPTMTQQEVDENFAKTLELWGEMKSKSGKPHLLFLISKDAVVFMAEFEEIRKVVLAMGLNIPKLEENITIKTMTQCSECGDAINEDEDDQFDGMCHECYIGS